MQEIFQNKHNFKARFFLILMGVGLIVFGCTRWYTTRDLISDHEEIVNVMHKEYAINTHKLVFTLDDMSEMAAEIRAKIYDSKGPYQWIEGLIVSVAAGVCFLLVSLFIKCRKQS